MGPLTKVFVRLRMFNIKLNPKKSGVCARLISWCRRRIDDNVISYKQDFIQGVLDLPAPSNAAELQKLLESAIWMRTSIPEFAKETFPWQDFVRAAQMKI